MATKVMTQNGAFIQKIHRQFVFSANAPPMTGPATDPIAHCRLISENHLPRSLNVTMSEMMMYVKATSPPPPMPCTERPTSSTAELLATEAMMAPIVNNKRAAKSTGLRPMIWEKEAHDGWNTVEVRRNEVPAQNVSTAVPLRAVDIV